MQNNNSKQTNNSSFIPSEDKMSKKVTFSDKDCYDDFDFSGVHADNKAEMSSFLPIQFDDQLLAECKEISSSSIKDKKIDLEIESIDDLTALIALPRFVIEGATPFPDDMDLFDALDNSEAYRHKERNMKLLGNEYPLDETNRVSPYDAVETDILLKKLFEDKGVFCIIVTHGMFFRCDCSIGFGYTKFKVKLYFFPDKNPIIEFRQMAGDSDIFFDVYYAFLKVFFGEEKTDRMKNTLTEFQERVPMTPREENDAISSLVRNLKSRPEDFIETVVTLAMEKKQEQQDEQIVLCNEVYNSTLKRRDISSLVSQILGFTDAIQSLECILDVPHKLLILERLKTRLSSCIDSLVIPESVRIRARDFISRESLTVPTSEVIVEEEH